MQFFVFLGLAGDLKKAMKDGKPIIIEVCATAFRNVAMVLNLLALHKITYV